MQGVGELNSERTLGLLVRRRQVGIDLAGVDRRQQKDLVVPNNRSRRALPVNRRFPCHILHFAPFQRRLSLQS